MTQEIECFTYCAATSANDSVRVWSEAQREGHGVHFALRYSASRELQAEYGYAFRQGRCIRDIRRQSSSRLRRDYCRCSAPIGTRLYSSPRLQSLRRM